MHDGDLNLINFNKDNYTWASMCGGAEVQIQLSSTC